MALWFIIRRLTHVILVLTAYAFSSVAASGARRWRRLARLQRGAPPSAPDRVRTLFEKLGGTFIKFGQMLALQPDVIPLEYCRALFDLLDCVPSFAFKHVEQTFVEDLGRKPSEIFDHFSPTPSATGSIGQVHVAVLGGRKLAVKVRRPTVVYDFAVDLCLMLVLVKLIEMTRLKKLHWVVEPVREFVAWTREELDYRHEARHMLEFDGGARDLPERVPSVLWDYTTERILTAEYLEGVTALEYIRSRAAGGAGAHASQGIEPERLARRVVSNFVSAAFRRGVFHADLHPANLMIMPSGEVGYVDFGIVGILSPYSRYHLITMTLAYVGGDLDGMCESFFKVSVLDESSSAARFRAKLKEFAGEWYGERARGPRLRKSFTLVMIDLLTLSRAANIWPQREVIKYIRSTIALDGLIKNFAPGIDLARHLEQSCEQYYQWQELQDLIASDERMASCVLSLPRGEQALARQELENLQATVRHFGLVKPSAEAGVSNSLLAERVRRIPHMKHFDALWATEGLGFLAAEAAWESKQCPRQVLSGQRVGPLPASSAAAIHVGISLSFARRLLTLAEGPEPDAFLNAAVRKFLELCETRCPEGCEGVSAEALGLVVRTLKPHWLLDVDRELQEINPELTGYFWHGVGRGLYFIFPPALYSQGSHSVAVEKALQDPPHETGRLNALAGLAWPLTLVNIRQPEVLDNFLRRHGAGLSADGAFSSGVATSILLWLAWAGRDSHLNAFHRYRPRNTTPGDAALWNKLVTEPCSEVMECHHERLGRTKQYGELFHYQPLPVLAERLNDWQPDVSAASGM